MTTTTHRDPLVEAVLLDFCPQFAQGGTLLYVAGGDEAEARQALQSLGVEEWNLATMPDLVVYYPAKNYLYLVDTITGQGLITEQRKEELELLFQGATPYLVFVTAFQSRAELGERIEDLAWSTNVWFAEEPRNLVHLNSLRLGEPY